MIMFFNVLAVMWLVILVIAGFYPGPYKPIALFGGVLSIAWLLSQYLS